MGLFTAVADLTGLRAARAGRRRSQRGLYNWRKERVHFLRKFNANYFPR